MAAGWHRFKGASPYPELAVNADRSSFTYGSLANRSFRMKWIQGKRDERAEKEVLEWIGRVTGEDLPLDKPALAAEALADGVILCRFVQSLNKHALAKKISTRPCRFAAAENLANFQDGLVTLGLHPRELFRAPDLLEKKQLEGLVQTMLILKEKLER